MRQGRTRTSGNCEHHLPIARRIGRGRRGGWDYDRRGQRRGKQTALTLGQRSDPLRLDQLVASKELAASTAAPAPLTDEHFADRPAARLGRAGEEHIRCGDLTESDTALQACTRESNLIRTLKRSEPLRLGGRPSDRLRHVAISLPNCC